MNLKKGLLNVIGTLQLNQNASIETWMSEHEARSASSRALVTVLSARRKGMQLGM